MSGIKSIIFNEIIKYAQDDFSTAKDRKKLVDNIFSKLDTNGDNKLSDKDEMNDFYKRHFGIELSDKPITKNDLLETIDDIAVEMSFEDAPESDFSEDYVSPEDKEKINYNAYKHGEWIHSKLQGDTDDRYYTKVNKYLSKDALDENNIIKFLEGFYSIKGNEGIIELLDDEHDSGKITMENKKNIISSLIKYAENNNLGDDPDVEELKMFLDDYNSETNKSEKDFNNNGWCDFSQGIWNGILSFFGDRITDNEKIDKCIKSLYETIKQEQEN